jgi:hypothetical protein
MSPAWLSSAREKLRYSLWRLAAMSSRPLFFVMLIAIQRCAQPNPLNGMQSQFWQKLSRVGVTIDGVWIGEYIYWPFIHRLVSASNYNATANLYNSEITTATAKPFPAFYIIPKSLFSNSSKQWRFFSFCAHSVVRCLILLTNIYSLLRVSCL